MASQPVQVKPYDPAFVVMVTAMEGMLDAWLGQFVFADNARDELLSVLAKLCNSKRTDTIRLVEAPTGDTRTAAASGRAHGRGPTIAVEAGPTTSSVSSNGDVSSDSGGASERTLDASRESVALRSTVRGSDGSDKDGKTANKNDEEEEEEEDDDDNGDDDGEGDDSDGDDAKDDNKMQEAGQSNGRRRRHLVAAGGGSVAAVDRRHVSQLGNGASSQNDNGDDSDDGNGSDDDIADARTLRMNGTVADDETDDEDDGDNDDGRTLRMGSGSVFGGDHDNRTLRMDSDSVYGDNRTLRMDSGSAVNDGLSYMNRSVRWAEDDAATMVSDAPTDVESDPAVGVADVSARAAGGGRLVGIKPPSSTARRVEAAGVKPLSWNS